MRAIGLAVFLVSVVSLSSLAIAQGTRLGSGSRDFTVNPIILFDIPLEEGDYCGNPSDPPTLNFKLGLNSDPNFLNIRWNAKDPGGIERQIGVDCWLNCPASSNLQANCAGFQTCSYRGPTGQHACSVQGPKYNFNSDNRVVCRFFDPIIPSLDLVIENRTFRTVDYEIGTPPITVTVGSPVTVPIDVKSFGILENSFTNNMSVLQGSSLVTVSNGFGNTDSVKCGEVGRTFPSVSFLSSANIPFSVLSHSSVDTTPCSSDSQCSYLEDDAFSGKCVAGACWKRLDITINAGVASLPEYGVPGFIFILLASSAVFFLARRRL